MNSNCSRRNALWIGAALALLLLLVILTLRILAEDGLFYRWQRGDTAALVAKRFGVAEDADLLPENLPLQPGTLLFIPGGKQPLQTEPLPAIVQTASPSHPPESWSQVEALLSQNVLGTSDGKCEWGVWGWQQQEVYAWALCQTGPMPNATAIISPVVLILNADGLVQAVENPGLNYAVNIRRLFPPAVQERIFANDFDGEAAQVRLAARWKDRALPPAIYAQSGGPLPRIGQAVIPAISAGVVERVVPMLCLGAGSVIHLAFLDDGRLAAYGPQGIELIDPTTIQAGQPHRERVAEGAGALGEDGRLLASWGENWVKVIRVEDGQVVRTVHTDLPGGQVAGAAVLPDSAPLLDIPVQGVTAGTFTPDSSAVVLAGEGTLGWYSSASGELVGSMAGAFPAVVDLSFAPEMPLDGSTYLAVRYGENTPHTLLANWEIPQGTPRFLSGAYSAASLAYARHPYGIAVGSLDGTVQMVDPLDGPLLRTFSEMSAQVQTLSHSAWGHLAAGSMNEVRLYAPQDPKEGIMQRIPLNGGWVTGLAWSCYLVAAPSDGAIHVLDEAGERTLQILQAADEGFESHLAISPDCGQILAARNHTVYRWQVFYWDPLPAWTFADTISALAIAPNGSLLAAGFVGGELHLLDSANGNLLRKLEAQPGGISALAFSPDGRYLASGGRDGVVVVYAVK